MALLDVKEINYAKYVLGNIILPAGAILFLLKKIGKYFSEGGATTVLLAQIGCECIKKFIKLKKMFIVFFAFFCIIIVIPLQFQRCLTYLDCLQLRLLHPGIFQSLTSNVSRYLFYFFYFFYLTVLVVSYCILSVLRFIYRHFLRKQKDVLSYGKWAVVTGATSGIGESFCYELAERGMNILLISRNEEKLKTVASKVEIKFNVKTQYLIRDFSDMSATCVSKFTTELDLKLGELDKNGGVGMLCNCVGVVNGLPSLVHETDAEEVRQILCVNNDGTVLMSRAVLPYMMGKRSGAIITVSSGSCRHPTPLVSLYSATKAFGHQFTRSMHYEYKEFGIDCISVTPYYFISNLYKRKKATFMAPFPETIIKATLPLLGYEADAFPYWAHWLGCEVATKWTPKDPADRMLISLKQNRERALARNKKA